MQFTCHYNFPFSIQSLKKFDWQVSTRHTDMGDPMFGLETTSMELIWLLELVGQPNFCSFGQLLTKYLHGSDSININCIKLDFSELSVASSFISAVMWVAITWILILHRFLILVIILIFLIIIIMFIILISIIISSLTKIFLERV